VNNKLQLQEQLLDLLRRCTLKLTTSGGTGGTGFFVAPGTILTCAHVIQEENQPQDAITITAYWNHQLCIASIEKISTQYLSDLNLSYPDLALLRVNNFTGHPCVYLHDEVHLKDEVYSYGYTDEYGTGDPSSFESEDWTDERRLLLKLKGGLARPGLSGGPVLNLRTGGVCAILKRSRNIENPTGGRAIPTHKVFEIFPELKDSQREFHHQYKRWYDNLTPEQRDMLGMLEDKAENDATVIEIFYSYVDEDKGMATQLQKHLILLQRQGLITDWSSAKLELGKDPSVETMKHLNSAKIILLLISSDYLFSDYQYTVEVKRAMERSKAGEAIVIPILLSTTDDLSNTPFGKLLAIPRNRKPINKWSDKDEALAEIAKEIRAVVNNLKSQ
jgi:hypothetical protein